MKVRSGTVKRRDKKIFSKTANKTKKINIMPRPMRGGIRL